MKKKGSKRTTASAERDDMFPEYDLASMPGGVRGKYYKDYREGHTVKVHKTDGTTVVQHFQLKEGAVMLDPDVRQYFPDSEAVNNALRCLISLMPKKRKTGTKS